MRSHEEKHFSGPASRFIAAFYIGHRKRKQFQSFLILHVHCHVRFGS